MIDLRLVCVVMAAFLLSLPAISQAAQADESDDSEARHYQYGKSLDIQRVISEKSDPWACGVVPAVMRYEDSQGQIHEIEYSVLGTGCKNSDS